MYFKNIHFVLTIFFVFFILVELKILQFSKFKSILENNILDSFFSSLTFEAIEKNSFWKRLCDVSRCSGATAGGELNCVDRGRKEKTSGAGYGGDSRY